MSGLELCLIGVAALFGSAIAAIAGLGGGILLMAVLLQFLDPLEVVPIHGVIQLASNSSRAVILRDDVDWAVVWRFALLLLPAGLAGLLVAGIFPVEVGSILIALFALLFVWWPQGLGKIVSCLGSGRRTFIPLGAIAGFLNIPFGVTGPAVTPVFRSELPLRTAMVATFAMAQTFGHLAKVMLFAVDGFVYLDQLALLAIGISAVIVGTWFGTRVLRNLSEQLFGHLFRLVLTVIAIRVIFITLFS